jgi:hypothetical protein
MAAPPTMPILVLARKEPRDRVVEIAAAIDDLYRALGGGGLQFVSPPRLGVDDVAAILE